MKNGTLSFSTFLRKWLKYGFLTSIPILAFCHPLDLSASTDDTHQQLDLPNGKGNVDLSQRPGAVSLTEQEWWQSFGDSILVRLVSSALANNYDAKAAVKRVEASRQLLRQSYSSYYPTLSVDVGYSITKDSGIEKQPYSEPPAALYWNFGGSLNWEIDIFGRVAEKVKGSKASLEISKAEYDAVNLTLACQVASLYASLRMYERQLHVACEHLTNQEEVLHAVEARYKAGLVSKLDVAQAQSMLSTTRLLVPGLEANIATTRNSLATLCVMSPEEVESIALESLDSFITLPEISDVNIDLILNRPDVKEADRQITLLSTQLGIAKKEWLPYLSLSAQAHTHSHEPSRLFEYTSFNYSVAPTLSWTIFDGLNRSTAIAAAKADMEAQIETYNQTVAMAIEETRNALQNYKAALTRLSLYDDVLASGKEALSLSVERYRLGLTDFSDVSSAQISYLGNQTNFEAARTACFSSIINLYKALGGGDGIIREK